jgi:hypothetical protein
MHARGKSLTDRLSGVEPSSLKLSPAQGLAVFLAYFCSESLDFNSTVKHSKIEFQMHRIQKVNLPYRYA